MRVNKTPLALQVPKETGTDLLGVPEPGRDERRRRSAVQLAAHAEEAHPERRLRGERHSRGEC